jgi:hypothetical protein
MVVKNIFLTITLLILCFDGFFAQTTTPQYVSETVNFEIAAGNIQAAKNLLLANIDTSLAVVKTYNESNAAKGVKIYITVNTNKAGYEKIEKIVPQLGFLDNKRLGTINNSEEIAGIDLEIAFLKSKKAAYETELEKFKGDDYKGYWNEVREIEQSLFNLEKRKTTLKNQVYFYIVDITLYEDIGTPQSSNNFGDVQFVNMPGVGATQLMIENPLKNISSAVYRGYEVKYLFTRGKSYAVFGSMKAQNVPSIHSDSLFTDLFMYGFGQDFYPRHLGKGRRKVFNLYSGYRVGGTFASAKSMSKHYLYATPHLGVEIVKTKYILLDVDAGYYIPFYQNNNLRGLQLNASFNFLF